MLVIDSVKTHGKDDIDKQRSGQKTKKQGHLRKKLKVEIEKQDRHLHVTLGCARCVSFEKCMLLVFRLASSLVVPAFPLSDMLCRRTPSLVDGSFSRRNQSSSWKIMATPARIHLLVGAAVLSVASMT